VKEVVAYFEEKMDLATSMIITGTKPLYADYLDHDDRLEMTIEDLYKQVNKVEGEFPEGMKYLVFTLSCQIKSSGDEANVPSLRYLLQ
jgi:hypothetical protein